MHFLWVVCDLSLMQKIPESGRDGRCRLGLIGLAAFFLALNPQQIARAQCDLQIVSAGTCLSDGTAGIPNVGDAYGLTITMNVVGVPAQPFRIRWTMANTTNYFENISLSPDNGYVFNFVYPLTLDDQVPWTVTLDPDGVSGDTNIANNAASGTFTPIPPASPVEFYAARVMHGWESYLLGFQPGSGTIGNLYVLLGDPTSHGAQSILSVSGPPNGQTVVTPPYGAPLFQVAWTNVPAATFQGTDTFNVQLSRTRVNPGLLRTNTWAGLAAMGTNWTQWLAPDNIMESTNPLVVAFVQGALPTNYTATMTPYDAARALHQAVMKRLTYQSPPYAVDAVGVLEDGVADCGGFSALFGASLRHIGIPARWISGFRQGDSVWHVRVEFHLPGIEWLVADPTDGNSVDPTGAYAYYFGYVPNADSFVAVDFGQAHVLPYGNFNFIQIANWWWNGGATYETYDSESSLEPTGVLSVINSTAGSIQFCLSDPPAEGSVVIEISTNLANWLPIATNSAAGATLFYSFPTTNQPAAFFRARLLP
jgi:transglutaminase-like putative cysteine protease